MPKQTPRDFLLDFANGFLSAFKGMWITWIHLFRPPVTIQYPKVAVKKMLPERSRGLLTVDTATCIACRACERGCPIQCIRIEDVAGEKATFTNPLSGKAAVKLRYPTRFEIDLAKCMFCGFCSELCPTAALRHSRDFDRSVFQIEELCDSHVSAGERERLLAKAAIKKAEAEAAAKTAAPTPREDKG